MDVSHFVGGDLIVGPTGDLALVDGIPRGTQRILRRLITVLKTYIWHLDYGAGLELWIGRNLNIPRLTSIIVGQVALEDSVARNPAPIVTITPILNGVFVQINYIDAGTLQANTLSFEVS